MASLRCRTTVFILKNTFIVRALKWASFSISFNANEHENKLYQFIHGANFFISGGLWWVMFASAPGCLDDGPEEWVSFEIIVYLLFFSFYIAPFP